MLPTAQHRAMFRGLGQTYRATLLGSPEARLEVSFRASSDNDSEFGPQRRHATRRALYINTLDLSAVPQGAQFRLETKLDFLGRDAGPDPHCGKTYRLVDTPEHHPSGCYIRCQVEEA